MYLWVLKKIGSEAKIGHLWWGLASEGGNILLDLKPPNEPIITDNATQHSKVSSVFSNLPLLSRYCLRGKTPWDLGINLISPTKWTHLKGDTHTYTHTHTQTHTLHEFKWSTTFRVNHVHFYFEICWIDSNTNFIVKSYQSKFYLRCQLIIRYVFFR